MKSLTLHTHGRIQGDLWVETIKINAFLLKELKMYENTKKFNSNPTNVFVSGYVPTNGWIWWVCLRDLFPSTSSSSSSNAKHLGQEMLDNIY